MKNPTEQRIVKLIRERIKSEYRKHGKILTLDWQLIAAIKIVRTLKELDLLKDISHEEEKLWHDIQLKDKEE